MVSEWIDRSQIDIPDDNNDYDELVQFAEDISCESPLNISRMMNDIYMAGTNMTGQYQGCWVKFKDIEQIVNQYMNFKE